MDLVGKIFGELEVIGEAPAKGRNTYWLCRCSCGAEKNVGTSNLLQGRTKSCGCKKYVRSTYNTQTPAPKCPYPAYACTKNKSGLCCTMCDDTDCINRCKNKPELCGLRKGEINAGKKNSGTG